MPVNPDAVSVVTETVGRTWTRTDSLLYAVGVGCGQDPTDPRELPFVMENAADVDQMVLPTMAVVLADSSGGYAPLGEFDPTMVVHGSQSVEIHRPLQPAGQLRSSTEVTGLWDKGRHAVVEMTTRAVDAQDGEPLFDLVSTSVLRGEGGWGGERGPSADQRLIPDRRPDQHMVMVTRPEQALIYRLSDDRNPLHGDPVFALAAGFQRPILHGLCTYGFAGRALLHLVCDSEPDRFQSISGRFSAPVFPGDSLSVSVWHVGDRKAVFTVQNDKGVVVIDQGRFTFDG